MKLLICLLVVSVFALSAAAPRQWFRQPPEQRKIIGPPPLLGKERKIVGTFSKPLTIGEGISLPYFEEEAESQIEPISTSVLLGSVVLPIALKGASALARCALCDGGCSSLAALQSATDQRKEAAKLMTLGYAMESINMLKDLKRSMMKDGQMAEVEQLDLISSAIDGVGGIAKGILCKN